MKEKNKKFIKTLGVGAVATLGLFTMVGCSVSDEEKADMMEGLENANTFMEETIDLLKEQNRKLNEQNQELNEQNQLLRDQNETASNNLGESEKTNTTLTAYLEELKKQVKALEDSLATEQEENDILQNYLEELQKENVKITAEEAISKVLAAHAKLQTNLNGIRNNIRIICKTEWSNDPNGSNIIYENYQTENNGYITRETFTTAFYDYTTMYYNDNNNVYSYKNDHQDNSVEKKKYEDGTSLESFIGFPRIINSWKTNDLTAKDVVSVEILENGNYKIGVWIAEQIGSREPSETGYSYEYRSTLMFFEITPDDILVGYTMDGMMETDIYEKDEEGNTVKDEDGVSTSRYVVTIDYDAFTEQEINALLQEAINAAETPDED